MTHKQLDEICRITICDQALWSLFRGWLFYYATALHYGSISLYG